MLHYFLKKRLKKHDELNNVKLKSIFTASLLQQQALTSSRLGVGNDVDHQIVISLTSFDKRIEDVYLCIESLFQQTLKADKVILWLSQKNFPEKSLPRSVLMLCERGLEIRFVSEDIGPYKKIIYSLQEFPQSLIVTVDDDVLYPPDMLDQLYRAYLADPKTIHCQRAYRMSIDHGGLVKPYSKWDFVWGECEAGFDIFPTGVGGVLYFPGALHSEVFNSNVFVEKCPMADDVWLKAMSLMAGVKCEKIHDCRRWDSRYLTIEQSQAYSLKKKNWKAQNGNDAKLNAVFQYYDLYKYFS